MEISFYLQFFLINPINYYKWYHFIYLIILSYNFFISSSITSFVDGGEISSVLTSLSSMNGTGSAQRFGSSNIIPPLLPKILAASTTYKGSLSSEVKHEQDYINFSNENVQFQHGKGKKTEEGAIYQHGYFPDEQSKISNKNWSKRWMWIKYLKSSNICSKKYNSADCMDTSRIYRNTDGSCNNIAHPSWGSSFQAFSRFLPAEYNDGISSVRKSVTGDDLPSPIHISDNIQRINFNPSITYTPVFMRWGEFLYSDLSEARHNFLKRSKNEVKCCQFPESNLDCLPIRSVPVDHNHYSIEQDENCIEFLRTPNSPCTQIGSIREQINQVTSWIDGSGIYGSTEHELRKIRLFRRGFIKLQNGLLRLNKELFSSINGPNGNKSENLTPILRKEFFGDTRHGKTGKINVVTQMTSLWIYFHNQISDKLALLNPQWSDEFLFQETKKIVVASLQHITIKEFLPLLLGPTAVKTFGLRALRIGYYDGFNETVDATLPISFGTAAFRFGPSMLPLLLTPVKSDNLDPINKILASSENLQSSISVKNSYASPSAARTKFSHNRTTSSSPPSSTSITELISVTIQRGRDHGLAPYLKWREVCGLLKQLKHNGPLVNWVDFQEATGLNQSKVQILEEIYANPWDIDLFAGGILELPVRSGVVGPTFACIIGQTFRNLRRGDRFWFENAGQFTNSQLQAIRNVTLSRILCDTIRSLPRIRPFVFLAFKLQNNPLASCLDTEAIPKMDLRSWNQVNPSEAYLKSQGQSDFSFNTNLKEPMYYNFPNYFLNHSNYSYN